MSYYKVTFSENNEKKKRVVEASDSFDALLLILKFTQSTFVKVEPVKK